MLFHPPLGVLFTFPSRYLYAIGCMKSLALEGGPPSFPQDCTCLVVLRMPLGAVKRLATGLSPALVTCSKVFACVFPLVLVVLQPRLLSRADGLGWSRFARHYYGSLA